MTTRHLITGLIAAAAATSAAQAGPLELADLFDDFNTAAGSATAGDAFTENNWTALSGFGGGTVLIYDPAIPKLPNTGTVAGWRPANPTEGEFGLPTPHFTSDGVFDGLLANPGELGFHPSFNGPSGDPILRWTADQAYSELDVDYNIRRGNPGSVGLAIRLNDGGVYGGFNPNNGGGNNIEAASAVADPDGFNALFVDGSAEWRDYDPVSGDIEICWGGVPGSGFWWAYNSNP